MALLQFDAFRGWQPLISAFAAGIAYTACPYILAKTLSQAHLWLLMPLDVGRARPAEAVAAALPPNACEHTATARPSVTVFAAPMQLRCAPMQPMRSSRLQQPHRRLVRRPPQQDPPDA